MARHHPPAALRRADVARSIGQANAVVRYAEFRVGRASEQLLRGDAMVRRVRTLLELSARRYSSTGAERMPIADDVQ